MKRILSNKQKLFQSKLMLSSVVFSETVPDVEHFLIVSWLAMTQSVVSD